MSERKLTLTAFYSYNTRHIVGGPTPILSIFVHVQKWDLTPLTFENEINTVTMLVQREIKECLDNSY